MARCHTHTRGHHAGCPHCINRSRHYRRISRQRRRSGEPRQTVPIQRIRNHIQALLGAGMRLVDIAADARLETGFVSKVAYYTRYQWVQAATARAILGVTPRNVDRPYIDATGTHRRLQALAAAGWSQQAIADHMGVDRSMPGDWLQRNRVTRHSAGKVAATYEQLFAQPGPSRRTATIATNKGWQPPDAWDDSTIDNPDAQPYSHNPQQHVDELAVERVNRGLMRFSQLTPAEQRALLQRHHGTAPISALASRWKADRRHLSRVLDRIQAEVAA